MSSHTSHFGHRQLIKLHQLSICNMMNSEMTSLFTQMPPLSQGRMCTVQSHMHRCLAAQRTPGPNKHSSMHGSHCMPLHTHTLTPMWQLSQHTNTTQRAILYLCCALALVHCVVRYVCTSESRLKAQDTANTTLVRDINCKEDGSHSEVAAQLQRRCCTGGKSQLKLLVAFPRRIGNPPALIPEKSVPLNINNTELEELMV